MLHLTKIRIVDDYGNHVPASQTDKAIDLLSENEYIFDIMPVIVVELENVPGALARMAINYSIFSRMTPP